MVFPPDFRVGDIAPRASRQVHSFGDVEVELLAGRDADKEAIARDRFLNLPRVSVQHVGGALERGVSARGNGNLGEAAERRALFAEFLQAAREASEEG
jgi:hypothetical protein